MIRCPKLLYFWPLGFKNKTQGCCNPLKTGILKIVKKQNKTKNKTKKNKTKQKKNKTKQKQNKTKTKQNKQQNKNKHKNQKQKQNKKKNGDSHFLYQKWIPQKMGNPILYTKTI